MTSQKNGVFVISSMEKESCAWIFLVLPNATCIKVGRRVCIKFGESNNSTTKDIKKLPDYAGSTVQINIFLTNHKL